MTSNFPLYYNGAITSDNPQNIAREGSMNTSKNNLSDTIISELEKLIFSLKPGDRLPTEKELSERFGVGRSTIRESMTVFVAQKLVIRRNDGTFVADNTDGYLVDPLNLIINMRIGNIDDLKELREMLELNLIRLATERATPEDIHHLEHLDWMLREPGLSREEQRDRDIAFHRAIADATGNTIAAELLSALRSVIAKNLEEPSSSPVTWLTTPGRNYHQEFINCIRNHDSESAYQCMKDYFSEIHKSYISGSNAPI